jgi:hypothetical protein
MRTGGGGTRPADAGQATCSCSGGHPPAAAVSAADTSYPDTDLVDTHRGSGSSSGQPRRPRCPVPPPPRHRRGVRLGQDGGGPAAAVAARRQDRAVGFVVCAGQVARSTQPAERLSGCVDTGRGLPNTGSPHAPPLRAPATAAGHGDTTAAATLDSWRQDRPPPGSHVRPERDLNVRHRPARPADRQIRSLVLCVDLVGSSRIWAAHVGCLVGPDGSSRVPSDRLDDHRDDQGASNRSRMACRIRR